jgi:hypothetical protein
VVEDEDLLGDGVNVAARLKRSMSTPEGTDHTTFEKASAFFNSLFSCSRSISWVRRRLSSMRRSRWQIGSAWRAAGRRDDG